MKKFYLQKCFMFTVSVNYLLKNYLRLNNKFRNSLIKDIKIVSQRLDFL